MLGRLRIYFKERYPILARFILGWIVFLEIHFIILLNEGITSFNITIQEFIDALNLADKAFVMDINYDREDPADYPGINAYTIISGLNNGDYIEQGMADKLLPYENSVILFMSSKEIYLLEEEYKQKKSEK